jgi:E3 ubiquitin-protein ligase BRE1
MKVVDASAIPLTDDGLVKMEDRKRPASYENSDSAPPLKKQATSINGGSKPHPDADMPWKDDIEVSQPDLLRPILKGYLPLQPHLLQYTRC